MFQAWATSKVLQRLDLSKPSPKRRKKNLTLKTSENNKIIWVFLKFPEESEFYLLSVQSGYSAQTWSFILLK